MTVVTLLSLKETFIYILKKELKIQNNALTEVELENVSMKMYSDLVYVAKNNTEWGNEYHILAIATFLQFEIYIYTYFDEKLNPHLTSEALSEMFKSRCFNTGLHLLYKPLKNAIFEESMSINRVLYGHFDIKRSHYTAIIPLSDTSLNFIPLNNLFSQY